MTKDEFIDGYIKYNGLSAECRTADGVATPLSRLVALPCACGEPVCEGWAMVADQPHHIAFHNRNYGPRPRTDQT
jgi:hypothetical protein